jgi:hypothetical protein
LLDLPVFPLGRDKEYSPKDWPQNSGCNCQDKTSVMVIAERKAREAGESREEEIDRDVRINDFLGFSELVPEAVFPR